MMVKGSFNLDMLCKKIMKVMGKEAEIITKEENKDDESQIVKKSDENLETIHEKHEEIGMLEKLLEKDANSEMNIDPNSDEYKEMERHMMLINDESPNAKCIIS
ncbi:unnamed protein product [Cochlearia groenlandica]